MTRSSPPRTSSGQRSGGHDDGCGRRFTLPLDQMPPISGHTDSMVYEQHQNRCVTGKVASGPAERPPECPDHSESRARLITASTDKRGRGSLNETEGDARSASLDLIRRQLTRTGTREQMPLRWPLRRRLLLKTVNALNPMLMCTSPFGQRKRDLGLDWPRMPRR